MKRVITRAVVVAGAALGLFAVGQSAGAQTSGQTLYGLTTNDRLVTFSADSPDNIQGSVRIRGLQSRETLIGIDRRPANGALYAVGRSRSGATLYTVDPASGQATTVAPLVSAPTATNPNRTPIRLDGGEFGFDVNPAADAIRIVSDSGQNLRVIPSPRVGPGGVMLQTGDTFTDGTLNRAGAVATGVTAAAYLNNDNDPATATTLFDIDSAMDTLNIQNPPNDGTLAPVGPLGLSTRPRAGFDIVTQNGVNTAYAALSQRSWRGDGQVSRLVLVDVNTGFIRDLGFVGTSDSLRDIAA